MNAESEGPSFIGRAAAAIGAAIGQRAEQTGVLIRREIHRAASILLLLLLALVCVCGALGFAAAAILIAFGDAHRVLGASAIAGGLAVIALLAVWRARVAIAARSRRTGER
jgi:hypothetical protein